MPTNNQEWWKKRFTIQPTQIEDLDLDCDEVSRAEYDREFILTVRKDEIESFLRQEIRQAKIENANNICELLAQKGLFQAQKEVEIYLSNLQNNDPQS